MAMIGFQNMQVPLNSVSSSENIHVESKVYARPDIFYRSLSLINKRTDGGDHTHQTLVQKHAL